MQFLGLLLVTLSSHVGLEPDSLQSVTVRASIDYSLGGPQALSTVDFYLLPDSNDPRRLINERFGLPFPPTAKPGAMQPIKTTIQLNRENDQREAGLRLMMRSLDEGDPADGEFKYRSGMLEVYRGSIQKKTTDRNGNVRFEGLAEGNYWIFGIIGRGMTRDNSSFLWCIGVKSGGTIDINQHNATLWDEG